MAEPLKCLHLEHLLVLSVENVQLLLLLSVVGLNFLFRLGPTVAFLPVQVLLQRRDAIDGPDDASSVNASRDLLLPYA